MKLFAFTYAGGTADFYNELKAILKTNDIDLIAADYPGHGKRHREKYADSISALADDMLELIRVGLDPNEEYAIMGYSMGCLVTVEVLRKMYKKKDIKLPKHVFLAAHEPKTLTALRDFDEEEMDEAIIRRTLSFGAVPDELLNNRIFWRMYLPIYRADYTIIGRYDFSKLNLQSTIDLTIFYSELDTPYEEMRGWTQYFLGSVKYYAFSGNHFFIKENVKQIADIILQRVVEGL